MNLAMTEPRQAVMIVALGDSITEAGHQKPDDRWPEILRRALQERFTGIAFQVVNAGVGGNTSREGLARIERDVLRHRPRFVLFEFGNDATPEPDRHVPVAEFIQNLNRIIARVSEETGGLSIPMTFPPVIDRWHVYHDHPFFRQNGGQDGYQERYREATRQVAREHNLPLVDLDGALRKEIARQGPEPCILPDGVHLTAHGNERVSLAVLRVLAPEIEKRVSK
jgi:lysophospholipase L1-like esterase